ncbi:hypothetical protein [Xanthomonas citri]|uniref:hypothetical protein n=1 Tax=Xanthomonas citri TaxID=346 RepID=UPI001F5F6FED|nr:hypothetical protein [Xanthomonas citri]
MAHVRQKAALEFGHVAQLFGLLVELGIQGQHALVGFFQLFAQGLVLLAQAFKFSHLGCRQIGG